MINNFAVIPQVQQFGCYNPTFACPIYTQPLIPTITCPVYTQPIMPTIPQPVSMPMTNPNQNFTTNYLDLLGNQNLPMIQKPISFTPSGIENLDNMVIKDLNGNIVQSVQYTKEGEKITQNINVQCCDGSVFKKVVTREGNKKTMDVNFKDVYGNQLATVRRTYEQIDDDTAISSLNGTEYKITGLKSGNVVTIEHNGQKEVIDLGKKLVNYTEDERENQNGEATQEQKDFLIQMIKKQPADIILKINKKTDNLVFLKIDDYEGFYNPKGRALKASPKSDSALIAHELGHAIYDIGNDKGWGETNSAYFETRAAEIENMKNAPVPQKISDVLKKFTTQNYECYGTISSEDGLKMAANEEFAEIFNVMNNIDIDNVWYKSTAILQYLPKSSLIAYRGSLSL